MLLLAIVLTLFGETLYLALRITLYNDLDDILRSSAALVINTLQADAQGNLTTEAEQPLLWNDLKRGKHFWASWTPPGR